MKELWHPVADPDWSAQYEITDDGLVRSKDRIVHDSRGRRLRIKGRHLKATVNKTLGYLVVNFQRNNTSHTQYVHRLVAEKFVRGDFSLSVNHKDGNKLNNHYKNLEWVSLADNTRHQYRTGLHNPSGQFVKGWRPKISETSL